MTIKLSNSVTHQVNRQNKFPPTIVFGFAKFKMPTLHQISRKKTLVFPSGPNKKKEKTGMIFCPKGGLA
jgi:hypothetical protein